VLRAQVTNGFESDKKRLKTIVAGTPYDAGSTATGPGIRAAVKMIQDYGRGAAVPKVLVLFTDGASNSGESVLSVMANLAERLQGITRYAVGIGSSINTAELLLFAGDSSRIYSINDYSSLSDIAGAISQSSCNSNANIVVGVPVVFEMPATASKTFSTPIPDGGLTVRVTVSNAMALGSADVYYSSSFPLPSKELLDGTAIRVDDTTLAFAVAHWQVGAARRAAAGGNASGPSVIYYTIESKADLGQVQVLPSLGSARLVPCRSGCTACDLNGQSCTTCTAGLELVRGGCEGGAHCRSGCTACSFDGQNCTSCAAGFKLDQGGCQKVVIPCGSGCTACDLDGQNCTSCAAGFKLDQGGCQKVVIPCGSDCTACDLDGQNCTSCAAGFKLVQGGCQQSVEGGLGLTGTILLSVFLPLAVLISFVSSMWIYRAQKSAQTDAATGSTSGRSHEALPVVEPSAPAQPGPLAAETAHVSPTQDVREV
jgi:hypothetical protein